MATAQADGGRHNGSLTTRVGRMLFCSGIVGSDPVTGVTPDDVDAEVGNCFARLRSLLAEAGGSLADVGQVTVFVREAAMRRRVGTAWHECFPDAYAQPSRRTILRQQLEHAIRIEAVAVLKV